MFRKGPFDGMLNGGEPGCLDMRRTTYRKLEKQSGKVGSGASHTDWGLQRNSEVKPESLQATAFALVQLDRAVKLRICRARMLAGSLGGTVA